MRRLAGLGRLLGASLGLLLLVAGVPVGLVFGVGFPRSVPSWSDVVNQLQTQGIPTAALLYFLALVCWVLWAYLMWSLVTEAVALIRRSPGRRRGVTGPGRLVAGALLASLFVGLQLMSSRAVPPRAITPLAAGLAPRTSVTAVYQPARPATTPGPGASLLSSSPSSPADQEVQVQPGDSLWAIAGREYGNPQEWTAIWGANQGQTQDNGQTFTDPSLIDPGWDLEVPNPSPAAAAAPAVETPGSGAAGTSPAASSPPALNADQEVQVQPGDSLWAISGREYGNPQDWTRIWDADQGQTEDNGQTFTDPSLIDPGWDLPVPALQPTATAPAAPTAPPTVTQAVAPASGAAPHDIGSALPSLAPSLAPVAPSVPAGGAPASLPTSAAAPRSVTTPPTDGRVEESVAAVGWGVTLAEGGMISLGVAAAAVAGLWLMRRHERRRWSLSSLAGTGRSAVSILMRNPSTVLMRRALTLVARQRGAGVLPTADQLQDAIERVRQMPGRIPVGLSRSGDVVMDVGQVSGLCLAGPGGEGAARAMAVSLLAHHGPDALGEVLTISGWGLVPGLERIRGVYLEEDLAGVVQRIQGELIRRERTLAALPADDFVASAATDDPLTALLVLLPTEALEPASRLAEMEALLEQGRRCGVAVVLVGTAPPADSYREVVVAADGSLAPAAAALMGGARLLYTPSASEAAVVAASLAGREGDEVDVEELAAAEEGAPASEAFVEAEEPTPPSAEELVRQAAASKPVRLSIFGGMRIFVGGEEVEAGIGDSGKEVLSLLAVAKRGQLTKEQGIDLISGGVVSDFDYGTYWDNGIRKTRRQLRLLSGLGTEVDFIPRDPGYRLNRELVDTDLWRLAAGIAAARRTEDTEERRLLLQAATDGVRGVPFAGLGDQGRHTREVPTYEWLVEEQPRVQQLAMQALNLLAELHADAGDLASAVGAVEQAMSVADGPCEELYRTRIRIEHRFGRNRAALATYAELSAQLAWDMPDGSGEGPDEETEALMADVRAALYGQQRAVSAR
jgi:nucleoid-associated protein YgaU/DNA-binding SARP family transcriptional activator